MNRTLAVLWGILYLICAVLGLLPVNTWVGVLFCLLFFVPPILLVYRASRQGDMKTIRRVRNLAILWLSLTLILLICNIASVALSEAAGTILYCLLAVLCAPLVCGNFWILALFLWACVLIYSLQELKKHQGKKR